MQIQLNDDYRIIDDPLQFILQHRCIRKSDGSDYWVNEGYYGTLNSLVSALLTREIHDADISTICEIPNVLRACTASIVEALQCTKTC